jgi:hypothetical protein
MANELQRMSTAYSETEDRVRLAGELAEGDPVVIWLSQRLLRRLLPALLQWLEQPASTLPRQDVLQGFAQQAARAGLAQQAPVEPASASQSWMALEVDVRRSPQLLVMAFRGGPGQQASLALDPVALRQWLNIVHDTFKLAEWSLDGWPEWVRDSAQTGPPASAILH